MKLTRRGFVQGLLASAAGMILPKRAEKRDLEADVDFWRNFAHNYAESAWKWQNQATDLAAEVAYWKAQYEISLGCCDRWREKYETITGIYDLPIGKYSLEVTGLHWSIQKKDDASVRGVGAIDDPWDNEWREKAWAAERQDFIIYLPGDGTEEFYTEAEWRDYLLKQELDA